MKNKKLGSLLQKSIRHVVTALAASAVLLGLILKIITFKNGQFLHASGAIIFYTLMFLLFVFRCSVQEASARPVHWIFAVSGTLLPLALVMQKSTPDVLNWISIPIEVAGMALSIIAIYTLGRSFGIVAAKREIKTSGMYRKIRHPLYAGEALWFLAIVLQNISLFNIALYVVQSACQVKRILEEEALLKNDETYAQYTQDVPWRMIPGIF